MYLSIVFLPLIGSALAGLGGRYVGARGATVITTTLTGLCALFSIIAFYQVGLQGQVCHLTVGHWINSEMFNGTWGFLFDSLTVCMLVVVTVISTLVHLYSTEYMSGDPHLPRFMSYLSLFTFFMLILVTADNFVQMFVGWEGVGLCSYLLINFWFTRIQANKAAMKAIIVNRVGDFGLSLGIMAIFYVFHAIDYSTVFSLAYLEAGQTLNILGYDVDKLSLICLFLFIGAVGKSAQLGLHTWLPDAMEGPTPVSALIHAATMVTAGVFLIIRCSPLFEFAPSILSLVTIVGALTAFFAATTGLMQNDLKRVIAYSTCSQLGYMVFACGLSSYHVSLFHLANHAFFKALLFLSAGSVIHALADEQDMRKMGGYAQLLPMTYVMILIGSLSLMGFPFLTGFYSKDVILELAYGKYSVQGTFAHWLGTISAFFTAFYSFRLIYLTFITKTNSYKTTVQYAHEPGWAMSLPLIILCIGSIFIGYLTKDMIIGLGTSFWGNAIFILPQNSIQVDSEFIDTSVKLLPVIFSITGAVTAVILYGSLQRNMIGLLDYYRGIYRFLNQKWYFDNIYQNWVAKPLLKFGYEISFKLLDRGFIEVIGPNGISRGILALSQRVSKLQTGLVYHYSFLMLIGLTLYIGLIFHQMDYRLYMLFLVTMILS